MDGDGVASRRRQEGSQAQRTAGPCCPGGLEKAWELAEERETPPHPELVTQVG